MPLHPNLRQFRVTGIIRCCISSRQRNARRVESTLSLETFIRWCRSDQVRIRKNAGKHGMDDVMTL